MNFRKYKIHLIIVAATLILFSGFRKDYFEVSKQLDIFATLFKELNIYYVDDTDPDKLMSEAINSMLETLDPYTTYMTEEEAEDFQVHTSGEYAGIGASVRKIDDEIVIVQTYEGYAADKAGLRAGDIILKVDGKKISKKDSDDFTGSLKGSVGSIVNMSIKRPGKVDILDFRFKREKIMVKAVPYFGMVNNEVGYITLNSFSRKASIEISKAFDDLKKDGMKYLILDFRGNPGGLLSQAVNVSGLFLPKETFIVETRGRIKDWNRKYFTSSKPKDIKIPIVLLTDYGTASASEIVAGALQDLDRAVIMGDRTYGKGLVQQPRSLNYGTKLKITIAKYYIPSGRSIQARDYFHRNDDGSAKTIHDSLRHEFTTRGGRIVYDGAGIEPDVKILEKELTSSTIALINENYLFKYAVNYCNKSDDKVDANSFVINDTNLKEFEQFSIDNGFNYESELSNKLDEIRVLAQYDNMITELEPAISSLEKEIEKGNDKIFENNKDEIKRILELTIINNDHYERGRYLYNLKNDKMITKATKLLQNNGEYEKLLATPM
jgi:carboxyl-terminal processing protease